jgi:hypothetical protein
MPRIPDSSQLGYSVPQARTPRFQDRSGQIVGGATQRLAGTVGRVADVLQEREDKFSYAQAKSTLLQADIETRRSLENDPDWGTFEKRYSESMTKAREKASGMIRSNRDRALFDMDAKLDVERGVGEVRGIARRKEVDTGRGGLAAMLDTSRATALNAQDEATRASVINNVQESLSGAVEKGYISEQERVSQSQSWSTSYAEGYIDLQPLGRQIEVLQKPDGTPAQLLQPDRRANLLKSALNEQRILRDRAEAEAKARQAELRQALGERVRDASASYRMGLQFDNPPSKAEFMLALDPENGAKAFAELQKDQDLSVELSNIARLPPDEQREALDKQAPAGTAGAAEQSERYNIIRQRTDALNRSKTADPASYVATHSPSIQQAYGAYAEDPDDPAVAQRYAQASIAEQSRLGVANPQILPKAQAESIAQSFHLKPEEGEKLAELIQTEREKWGRYWPRVAGQLMQAKMPSAAIAIARGMDPGAATRLAGVSAIPMAEMRKGVDKPPSEISDELKANMSDFQRSLDGVVGAENTFSAMYDAAERLSYLYLRQGEGTKKATERAYREVIGDHYAFREVHGRSFRVPIEKDVPGLEIGAGRALNTVPVDQLQAPIPTSTGTPESVAADYKRAIQRRGYWVTSANGENGLALFLDGAPVLNKDGSVYEVTWDALLEDITATRAEIQQQADDRLLREAQGLR